MELLEELKLRGLLQDSTPGLDKLLSKKGQRGYAGFDPTADSLHIGNLVPVTLLSHFQKHGNTPVALIGGATGMIGDPSGKSHERKLLSVEEIDYNLQCQRKQLEKFIDFDVKGIRAELVNNFDWFKEYKILDFLREVGKHLTVSYMMSKDSVKNRLDEGISFAEFSYQLIQGFDFLWLFRNKGVSIQMGGSDQWGNIVTGLELIRRIEGREAFGFTAPLITKADGSKFGKSEGGNVWLSAEKTSPYKFYQYWLNSSDEDAIRYMKIFSMKELNEIAGLEADQKRAPQDRKMQKELAWELTSRVHSEEESAKALSASKILFVESSTADLQSLSEEQLEEIFSDVPHSDLPFSDLDSSLSIVDLLSVKTGILSSKSDARRMLQSNSISLNKDKVDENRMVGTSDLIRNKFLIIQKGKKNYFLIRVSQ